MVPSIVACAAESVRRAHVSLRSERELRLGVADDPVAVLLGLEVDERAPVARLADRPTHHYLRLGEAHAAELDREPPQRRRVAARGQGARPGHQRHRVEPVEDVRRQADLPRELGVNMDRVEVARGARVAVRQVLVRGDPQLLDRLAVAHAHPPLTMLVQVARTTSLPSWFTDTDSKT